MTGKGKAQRDWTGPEVASLQSLYRQDGRFFIRDDEAWILNNVADFMEYTGRTRASVHGQAHYLRSKGYDFPTLCESRPWTADESEYLKHFMAETPRRSNIEVARIIGRSKQAIANKIAKLKAQGVQCNPYVAPFRCRGIKRHAPDSLERRTFDVCKYWFGSAAYTRERRRESGAYQDYRRYRVYRWLPKRQRRLMGEYDTRAAADAKARDLNERAFSNATHCRTEKKI